jgi:hypothetical protein
MLCQRLGRPPSEDVRESVFCLHESPYCAAPDWSKRISAVDGLRGLAILMAHRAGRYGILKEWLNQDFGDCASVKQPILLTTRPKEKSSVLVGTDLN